MEDWGEGGLVPEGGFLSPNPSCVSQSWEFLELKFSPSVNSYRTPHFLMCVFGI